MEYWDDLATLMEEDERALDVWAPSSAGVHQPNLAFQESKNGSGKASTEFAAAEPGKPQRKDFDSGLGRDKGDAEKIADSIDDFLDDFLAFASYEPNAGSDDMKITEGGLDLAWLNNLHDVPPSSPPISEVAVFCAGREGASSPSEDLSPAAGMSVAPPERSAAAEAAVAAVSAAAEAAATAFDSVACGAPAQPFDNSSAEAAPRATSADDGEGDRAMCNITAEAAIPSCGIAMDEGGGDVLLNRGEARQVKIARYLAKRKRRCRVKASSYESRKKVANSRPRHKGRFMPLVSDFIPIAELQRRQRVMMKEMQEKAARPHQEAGASSASNSMIY